MISRRTFLKYLTAISTHAVSSLPVADQSHSYVLATATTGGTYYPLGVAMAILIKVKLQLTQQISLTALTTVGSGENLKLLSRNEAQFAILQGLYGRWAFTGASEINLAPQHYLRAITMLWPNVEHFAIAQELTLTQTMSDLQNFKRNKFSIGRHNSGAEGSGRYILTTLGINLDDNFDFAYLGYTPTADALNHGTIKGFNLPGGVTVKAVQRATLALGPKMNLLNFTDGHLKQVNHRYPLWQRYTIPAYSYPNQPKAIQTIAQPNLLVVREDVSEPIVYQITKTIYDHLTFLASIHPAAQTLSLARATQGLPLPLHQGAARYYREHGIKVATAL